MMKTEGSNPRSWGIDVLKAIAALLIMNSHLEPLHPRAWMAADGMLGNTLFFFTTGFTLAGSLARRPDEGLGSFLWKRLSRLYPGVWLVALLVPSHDVNWASLSAVFGALLFPTFYTFVKTAVPLYPLFFLAVRRLSMQALSWLAIALLLAATAAAVLVLPKAGPGQSIAWSELGGAAWAAYFAGVLLLGAVASAQKAKAQSALQLVSLLVVALVGYFGLRFIATSAAPAALASALRPVIALTLPLCLAAAWYGLRAAGLPSVQVCLEKATLLRASVAFLAAHSWETYLLHEGIARWSWVNGQRWPGNVLLVMALALALAPVLKWLSHLPFRAWKSNPQS